MALDPGAPGLLSQGSSVFAYDSTIDGGNGGHSGKVAQPTGPGAVVLDSLLFAQGCHFVGGDGQAGVDLGPGFCGTTLTILERSP